MATFVPQFRKRVSNWNTFKSNYGADSNAFSIKPGDHFWKPIEDEHKDKAKEEYGVADFLSFDKVDHEYAIVAVGTTGTGKSSVVQLFCGDGVQVSHATVSQTKTAELFEENCDDAQKNRKWMDTQGTDDSDMDDTDERILKKIFKKLWLKKIHFIIVLWMVAGDFDRQKGEYLRQAKFINSLQNEHSRTNIWKSTLMVQKMGTLQPKMKKIKGLVDAAKNNGAKMVYLDEESLQDHILGFKCIDMIDDDPMYEALMDADTSSEKLIQLGYVSRKQMKSIVHERLTKLGCFMIEYEDLICEKCSLRGDPRYLYYKCHHKPIPHHPQKLTDYHPDELEEYHPLNTHIIHPGKVEHIHPRDLEDYHPESIREEEVDDKDNPVYFHPGDFITIISGQLCCTKETQQYNCCQAETKRAKGCKIQYHKKTVLEYPCCKKIKDKEKDEEEKGCDEEFHGGCTKRYLCCQKKEDSDPCTSKYKCCDKPPNSEGCTIVWKCCEEKKEDSKGCEERFKCCEMPDKSRGCLDKWGCCDQAPEEKGCETVCDRCDINWGHKPGCSWPEIVDDAKLDQDKDEEDPDYGDNYDEAHNPALSSDNVDLLAAKVHGNNYNNHNKEPSPVPELPSSGLSTDELL